MHALNGGVALAAQCYGTPDADCGQTRTPVPAIAKLSLAHHDAKCVASPAFEWWLFDLPERRVKAERERIGFVDVQALADSEDRLAKHIFMSAQLLAVEPDGDERVQSLEDQQ